MSIIATLFPPAQSHRATTRNPLADWLADALGIEESASGIEVTPAKALTYSPAFRAVALISGDVAKLPLHVYRRVGEGKERAPEHAAYRLLRYKASGDLPAFFFKRFMQAVACLRGNAYAYIYRRGDGRPTEMVQLASDSTTPVRENGVLWYVHKLKTGEQRKLRRENVFHLRGVGDGLEGWSVVTKARNSLGLGMAAEKYGALFFKNGARYDIALEHPATLSPTARANLRKSWNEMHQGLDESHKVAILEEGMKASQLSFSSRDAQFLEMRQHQIREVANWFGVPPHKLGDTTRTAFASLEQENQSYLDEALDPWLCAWEAEAWDKLLTTPEQQRDTHVIEFVRNALARANMADRGAFYNTAIQGGWMNRDEVRGRENLNPMPDGEGQKFFAPLNMQILGEKEDGAPPAEEPQNDDEGASDAGRARYRLMEDTLGRVVRRIATHLIKAARQHRLKAFLMGGMDAEHRGVCVAMLQPVACVLGIPYTADQIVNRVWAAFGGLPIRPFDAKHADALAETLPASLAAELLEE